MAYWELNSVLNSVSAYAHSIYSLIYYFLPNIHKLDIEYLTGIFKVFGKGLIFFSWSHTEHSFLEKFIQLISLFLPRVNSMDSIDQSVDTGFGKRFEIMDKFVNLFLSTVEFGGVILGKFCSFIHFVNLSELFSSMVFIHPTVDLK